MKFSDGLRGGKYIVLGVAFGWGKRKGLDVFIQLTNRLDDEYQIVLVGTDDRVDKQLPDDIISIHRTQNQQELAEIYSTADVFVNPTREEVLGMVNLEALSCGIPVITFRTGGSPECINKSCGMIVDIDDIDVLKDAVISICKNKSISKESCVNQAKSFESDSKWLEYIRLYKE